MSVKRFDCTEGGFMDDYPDGHYVEYEAYEQLKAEVEHWKEIAEQCAVAQTKTEACHILEQALEESKGE